VVAYHKANNSALLKRFLARVDDLAARVQRTRP
jgi:hypothetical protein